MENEESNRGMADQELNLDAGYAEDLKIVMVMVVENNNLNLWDLTDGLPSLPSVTVGQHAYRTYCTCTVSS